MLYVPFWILIIIHGSNFWKWFVAPGLIFIAEKISRSKFIKRARYGNTYIEEITLLPSGVSKPSSNVTLTESISDVIIDRCYHYIELSPFNSNSRT